jgi:regulatory protein
LDTAKQVLNAAIRCLARREYSASELTDKLLAEGHSIHDIEATLAICQAKNYQSDPRFAAMWVRLRTRQGYGPLVIRRQLSDKGITSDLIDDVLTQDDDSWSRLASEVWLKKYGKNRDQRPFSPQAVASQQRFLMGRGFSFDTIRYVLKTINQEIDINYEHDTN